MRSRVLFALVGLVVVTAPGLALFGKASAANAANWQAGRIIDDGVFMNSGGMSVVEIQNFLNQKVGTGGNGKTAGQCDSSGSATSELGGGSRADYGAAHSNPAPFTCLKDYYEVPKTDPAAGIPANNYGGVTIPTGAKSAAQIIWDAGQRYSINPKVLLVMIQKESAGPLITDDWPFQKQYTYAMGAHCPDGPNGAQCDSNYAGFSIQIYESARLMRYYLDNMQQSWWTYAKPYQVNQVRWNTQYSSYVDGSGNSVACGAGAVNISDRATAALYTYTPYQPNQAALNNLYGSVPLSTGFDSRCAAYGNRNFWRIYIDWFGSIYADPYNASFYGQSGYPTLNPGQTASSYIMYQNTGGLSWYDDASIGAAPAGYYPTHLATSHALNRSSAFGSAWPSYSRAANNFAAVYESDGTTLAANQHLVTPGQIVKFAFTITAPQGLAAASYPEYFQPVAEGTSTGGFNDPGSNLLVTVNPVPNIAYKGQSAYPTVLPSSSAPASLLLTNTGSTPLYDDASIATAPNGTYPVHLATSNPLNRTSSFAANWPSGARPSTTFAAVYEADGTTPAANQHVAQPGQVIKFGFDFTAPSAFASGTYQEYIRPILEGTSDGYFTDQGISWQVTVPSTSILSVTPSQRAIDLASGQPGALSFVIKNLGNTTAGSGTQLTTGTASSLQTPAWTSSSVVQTLPQSLAPGDSVTITVPVLAPKTNTTLSTSLGCVFKNGSTTIPTTNDCSVAVRVIGADFKATPVSTPNPIYPAINQKDTVSFSYRNTGNQLWYDDTSIGAATWRNALPVHLATTRALNRGSGFSNNWPSSARPAVTFSAVYEADGITLASNQHVAIPGQVVKFSFALSPQSWVRQGSYDEYFQPIVEGSSDGAFNQIASFIRIIVQPTVYAARFNAQSGYPTLNPGQQTAAFFMYQNVGNQTWYDDSSISSAPDGSYPVHLATTRSINRASAYGSGWPSSARPAVSFAAVYESDGATLASNQHIVVPGQVVRFNFTLTAPASGLNPATYPEYFQPVAEGTATGAFNDPGTVLYVTQR